MCLGSTPVLSFTGRAGAGEGRGGEEGGWEVVAKESNEVGIDPGPWLGGPARKAA